MARGRHCAWLAARLSAGERSNISRDLADAIGKVSLSSSSLPVLGMGRDIPDGLMYLEHGRLAIDWTTTTSIAYFDALRTTMAELGAAMGAEYKDNPLWWAKRVITVHPLGGAPMGRNAFEGVVDQWGRVFGVDDLFVLDGSAMPGPVGPNPALTIAAFADRAMEHEVEQAVPRGRRASGKRRQMNDGQPVEAQQPPERAGGTSVSFTEQMKGVRAVGRH